MSAAERIEDRAARYLLRREEPGWSEADDAELQAWLEQSFAHKAAYWRLEHGWDRAERLAALRSPPAPAARRDWPRPKAMSRARRWRPAAIAASLVAAIAVGVALSTGYPGPAPKTYATEIGGRKTVPLADGSKVELNTATTLRTRVTRAQRQVWLDRGEAYFDVARDTRHAFTVMAGPRRIVVLGTRFSVRREGDRITVAVVDGRVRVEPDHGVRSVAQVLNGGDVALADGASTIVARKPVDQVVEQLGWRDGMLTFDHSTLSEAAAEFNRYNRKQVVVRGGAANIRIGGTFEAANVDAFGRLLRQAYGLRVKDDGRQMTVGD